jgi:DNA invertase Pin-like site-specific DNA recombinase
MVNFIAYYRVSTKGQGDSGLGLDAQRAAVEAHRAAAGGTILKAYEEVESGKRSDRPELDKALVHARRSGATLIVAKLDRLSRNVAFLSALMESKVDFVCCDYPNATRLTIHILVAVAEDEVVNISKRTKAALQAAKARGKLLGSNRPGHWDGREQRRAVGARKGNVQSAKIRRSNAQRMHAELCPQVLALRASGLTLQGIADRLNTDGWKTPRKREWNRVYVCRFLKQCEGGK